jgi:hypothetical protein
MFAGLLDGVKQALFDFVYMFLNNPILVLVDTLDKTLLSKLLKNPQQFLGKEVFIVSVIFMGILSISIFFMVISFSITLMKS